MFAGVWDLRKVSLHWQHGLKHSVTQTIHWITVNVKQWVIDYKSKNKPEFVECIFSFSPSYSLILLLDGHFDYIGSYNIQLFVAM